jgi:hypothetical protein
LREALALDDENISVLSDFWGFSVVRLPFSMATILTGTTAVTPGDLLAGLDDLIESLALAGIYTLLTLQGPNDGAGTLIPPPDSFKCWSQLADRYLDEPAVLYEMYASALPLPPDWPDAAEVLLGAIRLHHPGSLVLVSGANAGRDVSDLPLRFSTGQAVENVVYTVRDAPRGSIAELDLAFDTFAQAFPTFNVDWSYSADDFGRSSDLAAARFARYGMGWAASFWNAEPRVVGDALVHKFSPTPFGLIVKRALAAPVPPQTQPLTPPEQAEVENAPTDVGLEIPLPTNVIG